MDPKITVVPERQNNIPREPAGKLLFDKLNSYDQHKVAVVEVKTGETYTYGDLISDSVNMAANLQAVFGIDKDDVIAVISENSYKFWVVTFAGFYLAVPLYLLNPGYTIYELKVFLANSRPKVIFASKLSASKVKQLREELNFVKVVVYFDNDENYDIVLYKDLIKNCCCNFKIETDIKIEDHVTVICNSSGTTGLPKGVLTSHEAFRLNIIHTVYKEMYPYGPEICALSVVPPYHIYGFNMTCSAFYLGAKSVIMDQFKPDTYLENIQKHKVTHLFIVPALADFLANSPKVDNYDLTSIQVVFSAAGALTEELSLALKKKLKLDNIQQAYGLTESGTVVFQTSPDHSRPGSCGKTASGHQVKIMDPKTKRSLGPNEAGEICFKGAIMKGYLNDLEKTNETIDGDGFLHSGDLGYYDEDGYFYIIDRLKDLIKYKSFQVPPVEIEQLLLKLPGVRDAAVVGKPDKRCGELPVAFVVKREGEEIEEREVTDFVAEHLCVEKRLHGGVKFVNEIPRGNSGKILRRQLRDML